LETVPPIEQAEELTPAQVKAAADAVLKENLENPTWRLHNLYFIIDKSGEKVLFKPNRAQRRLLKHVWYRNLILKARQRGFSTLIQIMMLDSCLWNSNQSTGVIAQDEPSATTIFRKIKFAYDNLPADAKAMAPLAKDSATELILSNGSSLKVATSVRSATIQFLHVSEFGKICAKYPHKAREILTGSLPAVDQTGLVFIESTAEGREGAFFDMTEDARALLASRKPISKLQYRFHFSSWHEAGEYRVDPTGIQISGADQAYFMRLEASTGKTLDDAQKAWYVVTRDTQFSGDAQMMKQEYPSLADEAFEQSIEGVYYANELAAARRGNRITSVPWRPERPVNTFWDIGMNDEMVIWFHQRIGPRDHWIDYCEAGDQPFSFFTKIMQEKPYTYGMHYLPHDGDRRFQDAHILKSSVDILSGLGLRNIDVVPRTPDVTIAIRQVRDAFPNYWFDETKCAPGLKHLGLYRKEWNERLAVWSSVPRHDSHSNAADAIRQHAQVFVEPSVTSSTKRKRRGGAMAS
jgi:hypothetical protein